MQETVIRGLDIRPGDLILDAGAGTGNLSLDIRRRGGRVVALDSSREALEICLTKDRSIQVICHDLRSKLPFSDNYFDKIVSVNTIFLIKPELREDVIEEFYRVLKKNGKIILVNLKKDFRSLEIYHEHFRIIKKKEGLFEAIKQMLKFIVPSCKLFYYAKKITGEHFSLKEGEQMGILQKIGFRKISKTEKVYANQAFLNIAYK